MSFPALILAVLLLASVGCAGRLESQRPLEEPASAPRLGLVEPGDAPGLGQIHWRTDGLAAARAEAAATGRTVFAFVTTSWCGPCKRMKEVAFHDQGVARAFNARLVPVMLDGERGEGLVLCGELHINSYPTMVLFGPAGTEIDRAFGYHESRQLLQVIDDFLHDRNTVGDLRRRVLATPSGLAVRQTLGLRLALRGDTAEAIPVLDAIVAADPDNKQGQASQALFALGRYVHLLKTGDQEKALLAFGQLVARFPASPAAREGAMDLVRLRVNRREHDAALAALTAVVDALPQDPQRLLDAARAVQQHSLDVVTGIGWATRATTLRGDGLPWFVLGQLEERRGDLKAAESAYRTATERSPLDANMKRALDAIQRRVAPPT